MNKFGNFCIIWVITFVRILAQSAVQCSRFYHFFKIFQTHKHAPLNMLAFPWDYSYLLVFGLKLKSAHAIFNYRNIIPVYKWKGSFELWSFNCLVNLFTGLVISLKKIQQGVCGGSWKWQFGQNILFYSILYWFWYSLGFFFFFFFCGKRIHLWEFWESQTNS